MLHEVVEGLVQLGNVADADEVDGSLVLGWQGLAEEVQLHEVSGRLVGHCQVGDKGREACVEVQDGLALGHLDVGQLSVVQGC